MPYGDPAPFRYWQTYFDTGEYLVGKWANSLELGCDCLGEIAYLDATVTDDLGEPRPIRNAICIHEEDHGILWKHFDIFNGSSQTRRQRRLVVSFFTTVGNYDYGFYWYFYLDGTIECEIKLTGALFTSGLPGAGPPVLHRGRARPGRASAPAPVQRPAGHDGRRPGRTPSTRSMCTAARSARRTPTAMPSPSTVTRLERESQAGRRVAPEHGRTWRVINTEKTNRLGQPVAYTLYPEAAPTLLADPGSTLLRPGGLRHAASLGHQVRPGPSLPGR